MTQDSQDSNPQVWAMADDTVYDGAASPTTDSTTEHLPDARDHEGAAPPTTETTRFQPRNETTGWISETTLSGDSKMTKHIKTEVQVRKQITKDKKLVTKTKTVNTITTDEETTEQIERAPIYVRLQVVSGPRDVDLIVPSVACGRLEAASAEHAGASRNASKT